MSNKVDILKIVRENNEKFKQHLQKIRELEEREKELNYPNLYRNYRKDGLTTISEKPTETCSANKNTYTVDNYDYVGVNRSNNSSLYERGVNINDINDINEEEQVDSFKEDSNYNERVSKEKDYMRINEEYKNNRTDYELSDDDTYDHKTNQELQGDTKKECEVQKREQGTSDESDDDQEQNQPDGGNTDEEEGLK